MNETINTILKRRSIRNYKQQQISKEDLNTLLEAGQYAPSAVNEQPWHFTIVQNKQMQGKLNQACKDIMTKSKDPQIAKSGTDPNFCIYYNAPTLIIISGDTKAIAPQIDCTLAMENMFLAGESLNIGSCWINAIYNFLLSEGGKQLKKELQIPEGFNVCAVAGFGYKAGEIPEAAERKAGTVTILQ